MTKDEFHSFLEYVYNEYLRERIHRAARYFDDPRILYHRGYEMKGLRRALYVINYIQAHCDDDDDVYSTFRSGALSDAVDQVRRSVRWNNELAREVGLLDALDQYYEEIVAGLDIADFPEQEFQMLRDFGFHDPKVDLQGLVVLIKMRQKESVVRQKEGLHVSRKLEQTVEILGSAQEAFDKGKEEDEEEDKEKSGRPKKPRRWFKGLGKIGQGAAMSIGDICLAAGIFKFPVSPETQTWGAIVSATAGVGMILDGVGELRDE